MKTNKKPKHPPKQLRESRRAIEAETYREGFNDGYRLGIAEGHAKAQRELKV